MSHSIVAKSHVETEEHEFLWTIDNFDFLSANPELLDAHVLPVTIVSSKDKISTWKVFLSQEEEKTSLFFQLVGYTGLDGKISIAMKVRVQNGPFAKFEWVMSPRNFTLGKEDKVKCNMGKYIGDSPIKLDQCIAENLSLEEICHQRGDNMLKLVITMKIFGQQSLTVTKNDPPPRALEMEQAQSMLNHKEVMLAMLETGVGSDVTFETRDGQRIEAHTCILTMQSAVFAAMFAATCEMKEKTDGVVKLVDMGGEGLKILLKFLYSGILDKTWGKFYEEIVNAANKYQITRLIAICDKLLPTVVSWENCVELLKFSELHGMTKAMEKIKKFMKGDPEKLLQLWHVAAFGSRLEAGPSSYSVPENDTYHQRDRRRDDILRCELDKDDDDFPEC
ncbi:uncharacterized protein LOC110861610 [Folsomia candida]|uniref:uncharacterized protein LOC110861610 n=1 Tax=Folsomia candida TaxID=158441 RepID=UPI000B8F6F3E|nr:uncharacterized protein LOC110861610 [Folsomia candida]